MGARVRIRLATYVIPVMLCLNYVHATRLAAHNTEAYLLVDVGTRDGSERLIRLDDALGSGLLDVGAGGSRLGVRVGYGCDQPQQGKTEQGEGAHVDGEAIESNPIRSVSNQ